MTLKKWCWSVTDWLLAEFTDVARGGQKILGGSKIFGGCQKNFGGGGQKIWGGPKGLGRRIQNATFFQENGRISLISCLLRKKVAFQPFATSRIIQNATIYPEKGRKWVAKLKCDHFPGKRSHFVFCDRSQVAGRRAHFRLGLCNG